ncbi:unnamed protein product [Blepharisma stoltei]|uniref:Uncharacterized protein n=1 Tax=Blepharisma stoltei TaxID=1481888 RepID=A0AAU9JFX6_9CILI|nr:unnamed protein product [Blepharisma stoltei]
MGACCTSSSKDLPPAPSLLLVCDETAFENSHKESLRVSHYEGPISSYKSSQLVANPSIEEANEIDITLYSTSFHEQHSDQN